MGNSSGTLNQDELEGLAKMTNTTAEEIQSLHTNFLRLDRDKKGYVSKKDIIDRLNVSNVDEKHFLNKLLDLFTDKSSDNRISFHEFAMEIGRAHV